MLSRAEKLAKRRLAPPVDRKSHGFTYRRPSHQVGDNAMPPPLELNPIAKPKADLRALEALDPPSGVPPAARLTIAQMDEIERLASLQINLFQIGVRLRYDRETWAEIVRCNPVVHELYLAGVTRAVVEHAEVLRELALDGKDAATVRYFLTQHGGPQWSPKSRVVVTRDEGPVAGLEDGMDVLASLDSSADEQRLLLVLLPGPAAEVE